MLEIPKIISVDDHVMEPPTLWTDRLSKAKWGDRIPHVERDRARFDVTGGAFRYEKGVADGQWSDWWIYDDLQYPISLVSAAVGFERVDVVPVTFDEIQPGCWKQTERLADMDLNHVEVSACFPNTLPRFCGQTFYERPDKELALDCVRAYNDWVIEEWCGGAGKGRLVPITIVPLWDPQLAAKEIHRCAAMGSFAVTLSENPVPLGLPSIHDPNDYWGPVFQACEDTQTTVCLHIGSSSKMPTTGPDAPFIISSTLTFSNAMGSMLDFIFSGYLERFPTMKVMYSEGQVGWMPYVLERADKLWHERGDVSYGTTLPKPPSSYIPGRVFGCIFDDEVGLRNRDLIGMDQICFEVDYPHGDTTFPHTKDVATGICEKAGLSEVETYKLLRGNAINALGLDRFGVTE